MDAVERVGGDAPAIAQPGGELAVIDGAAPEGRFGEAGLAAIVRDFLEQLLGVHNAAPQVSSNSARPLAGFWCGISVERTNAPRPGQPQSCPPLWWAELWDASGDPIIAY
jgi:hypothetical protein